MEHEQYKKNGHDVSARKRSILIVDDEQPIIDLLYDVLEEEGYTVVAARNGREAMDIVQQQRVDLVLTDYMMPHMDGWHLSKQLRSNPRTANIPVLVMSAVRVPNDGTFNSVIRKPFNLIDVLNEIGQHLSSVPPSHDPDTD